MDKTKQRGSKEIGLELAAVCGKPNCRYNREGEAVAAEKDEVFMVFVNSDLIVYHWYWHKCDKENIDLPDDYENRFREKLL